MSIFTFFTSFSMAADDQFLGSLQDDGDNSFSISKEGVGEETAFSGQFFTKATGVRDGTITSFFGGDLAEDEEGNQTNVIQFAVSGTNIDVDRSKFDSTLLTGNALDVWSLLTADSDVMRGSALADELRGFGGDDRMIGGNGDDELRGGAGFDTIFGGDGNDFMDSGLGDSLMKGGSGEDTIVGRSGDDRIIAGGAADVVRAGNGDDLIKGGGGLDELNGGVGADIIRGNAGADEINGDRGADTLIGGGGGDTLTGGAGDDSLTGGSKADTFVFDGNSGDDVVTDYRDGLDLILIDGGLTFADVDIQAAGVNTLITFGGATVTLLRQDATELTVDDFIF